MTGESKAGGSLAGEWRGKFLSAFGNLREVFVALDEEEGQVRGTIYFSLGPERRMARGSLKGQVRDGRLIAEVTELDLQKNADARFSLNLRLAEACNRRVAFGEVTVEGLGDAPGGVMQLVQVAQAREMMMNGWGPEL